MLEAIRRAPKQKTLYRGMEVSKDVADDLVKKQYGDWELPISSFSSDRAVAQEFTQLGLNDVSVFVEVNNARGLDISKHVLEDFRDQKEHLVAGSVRVKTVNDNRGRGVNWIRLVLEPV